MFPGEMNMEISTETSQDLLDQIKDLPLKEQVIEVIKSVYDPEIPVNIWDLGLIYDVDVEDNSAIVKMTLTAPACPVAGTMPTAIETKLTQIPDIKEAHVELVWDPPWGKEMMSEVARLELGMFD
jgi:FeS assembly SUF system protein